MSLALIHQIAKLLNSSSDLVRSLNSSMVMLMDYLPLRNPVLLLRDNVYNRYYIDVAPELDEELKNRWNNSEHAGAKVLKVQHQMVLYPGENNFMELPAPPGFKQDGALAIWQPVTFKQHNLPLSLLVAQVTDWDRVNEIQLLFNILSDMMAVAMVARGIAAEEIQEALPQESVDIPMILGGIVGQDSKLKHLAEMVRKVASSKATVLIHGESGTGKELIAKALHDNSIHRKAPFISVNCAALSDNLLESELFGHEKGAFTGATTARKGRFELADGGTLFLDEIGDTSLSFQTKILRVLQEGTFERLGGNQTIHVNVRVVCATNVELEDAILQGTFREDLYYRLNVIRLNLPPLRERKEDIPHLARFFLARFNAEDNKSVTITQEDLDYLQSLDWPGNIRELENYMHSGFLMEQEGLFYCERKRQREVTNLQRQNPILRDLPPDLPENVSRETLNPAELLEREEIQRIEDALQRAKGVQTKAADDLGISLRQLRYRIKKYNIVVRKIQG